MTDKPSMHLQVKLGTTDNKTNLDRLRRNMRNMGGHQVGGSYSTVTQDFEFPGLLDKFERGVIVDAVFESVTPTRCVWLPKPGADNNPTEENQ